MAARCSSIPWTAASRSSRRASSGASGSSTQPTAGSGPRARSRAPFPTSPASTARWSIARVAAWSRSGSTGRFGPGGFEPDTFQVWQLPLDGIRSWSRLSTEGTPPRGRYAPEVALDDATGTLYLVGGTDEVEVVDGYRLLPYGDTWALDLGRDTPAWSAFPVAGPGLPGAYDGTALFEASQRTLVVYRARDTLGTDRDSLPIWALPVDGSRRWRSLGPNPRWLGYSSGLLADPRAGGLFGLAEGGFEDLPGLRMHRLDVTTGGWTSTSFAVDGTTPRVDPWFEHQAVDPVSGSLVLAGGWGTYDPADPERHLLRSDVWTLDLAAAGAWRRLYSSIDPDHTDWYAPPVHDPTTDRLLGVTTERNPDTGFRGHFEFALGDHPVWTIAFHAGLGPSTPRSGALSIFDEGGRRLIVYGGLSNGVEAGDLWELSLAFSPPRWRRILPSTDAPRPRHSATWVLDPARRRAVMFGGFAGEAMQDTWELDLRGADPTWRRLDPAGALPPPRWDHSAIHDSRRDAMVIFGGQTASGAAQDTWSLPLTPGEGWVPLSTAGSAPIGRSGHAAAYDPIGDRMILLWGRDPSGARFDCHALEFGTPARWVDFLPAGEGPTPAIGSVLHYDAPRDRILIFGEYGLDGAVQAIVFDRPGAGPPPFPTDGPSFRLLGVGPNPSSGDVRIAFDVPRPIDVRLRLHDVRGRVVRDFGARSFLPGSHVVQWDGRGDDGARVRDGVYFARIEAGGVVTTGKLVVMD